MGSQAVRSRGRRGEALLYAAGKPGGQQCIWGVSGIIANLYAHAQEQALLAAWLIQYNPTRESLSSGFISLISLFVSLSFSFSPVQVRCAVCGPSSDEMSLTSWPTLRSSLPGSHTRSRKLTRIRRRWRAPSRGEMKHLWHSLWERTVMKRNNWGTKGGREWIMKEEISI